MRKRTMAAAETEDQMASARISMTAGTASSRALSSAMTETCSTEMGKFLTYIIGF
jgi:hypothetical protein